MTSAEIFTNFSRYPNLDTQLRIYLPLLDRLQGTPGVVSAAITNAVPLSTLQPGNIPFQTQVVPVLIKGRIESDNPNGAAAISMVLLLLALVILLGISLIQRWGTRHDR